MNMKAVLQKLPPSSQNLTNIHVVNNGIELNKKEVQLMLNDMSNGQLEMIKFWVEVELRERDEMKAF